MLENKSLKIEAYEDSGSARTLLSVECLKKYFESRSGFLSRQVRLVRAVDGVNLRVFKGETLGLVGESGSGKSTLGRVVIRLEAPTEGRILFDGRDVHRLPKEDMRSFRRDVQIVFQDPYASLNPRKSAENIIGEPLTVQRICDRRERRERVVRLMEVVGLTPDQMRRYPHEFSGGQRQRIGIARAIATNPKLIIADEPVSALDVSVQAQILNLLKDLQRDYNLTYIFISHDLRVVENMSDRIAVMYLGKIVEVAESSALCGEPLHPYTRALFSALPVMRPGERKERIILEGDVPSPVNPPAGCPFHPRCRYRIRVCETQVPALTRTGEGRFVACHLIGNDASGQGEEERGAMI